MIKGLLSTILLCLVCGLTGGDDNKKRFKPDAVVLTGFEKMSDARRVLCINKPPYNVAEFKMSQLDFTR